MRALKKKSPRRVAKRSATKSRGKNPYVPSAKTTKDDNIIKKLRNRIKVLEDEATQNATASTKRLRKQERDARNALAAKVAEYTKAMARQGSNS